MEDEDIVNIIRGQFGENDNTLKIPLLKGGGTFMAKFSDKGIYVDNLRNYPFHPWEVFIESISLLKEKWGKAKRGDAMQSKLGERGLPLDSIEGHIAHVIYGKKKGDTVFRRITPIACILIWSKICTHSPGELLLSIDI